MEGQQQFCSHLETLLNRVGVAGYLGADDVAIRGQMPSCQLQLLSQHVTDSARFFHKKTNIAVFDLQSKSNKILKIILYLKLAFNFVHP